MNKSFGLLVFTTLILISSCTKELPFPDVEDSPLLVVNALINPGEEVQVHVSQSCHLKELDCSNSNIVNAQVSLLDAMGNVISEMTHTQDGIYIPSNFQVLHNTKYQLEVNHNTLENIKSECNIPKTLNSSVIGVSQEFIDGYLTWAFDIEIDDNPDEENYYLIHGDFDIIDGEHSEGSESELNGYIEPHFSHFTDDPNAINKELATGIDFAAYPLRYVFLPDLNFNGKKYITRVGIRDFDLYFGEFKDVKANMHVKSVSKDMYEYIKTLTQYSLRTSENFSEPQKIFTNVEDGLGIFAGYTQNTFTLDLPASEYALPSNFDIQNEGCSAPCTVKFSTDGGPKLQYSWDFGDGSTSSEANPEHMYSEPGIYNCFCTASIGPSNSSSWGFTVEVK